MKKDIDKEVEICDCCEVHENLLQIVNETAYLSVFSDSRFSDALA